METTFPKDMSQKYFEKNYFDGTVMWEVGKLVLEHTKLQKETRGIKSLESIVKELNIT